MFWSLSEFIVTRLNTRLSILCVHGNFRSIIWINTELWLFMTGVFISTDSVGELEKQTTRCLGIQLFGLQFSVWPHGVHKRNWTTFSFEIGFIVCWRNFLFTATLHFWLNAVYWMIQCICYCEKKMYQRTIPVFPRFDRNLEFIFIRLQKIPGTSESSDIDDSTTYCIFVE